MRFCPFMKKVSWKNLIINGFFRKSELEILVCRKQTIVSGGKFSVMIHVLIAHRPLQQHLDLTTCAVRRRVRNPMSCWLNNLLLSGVFYLVVGGILVGFVFLLVEVIIKRQKERLEHKSEVSRTALIRWKKKAKVRMKHPRSIVFSLFLYRTQNGNNLRCHFNQIIKNRNTHETIFTMNFSWITMVVPWQQICVEFDELFVQIKSNYVLICHN